MAPAFAYQLWLPCAMLMPSTIAFWAAAWSFTSRVSRTAEPDTGNAFTSIEQVAGDRLADEVLDGHGLQCLASTLGVRDLRRDVPQRDLQDRTEAAELTVRALLREEGGHDLDRRSRRVGHQHATEAVRDR